MTNTNCHIALLSPAYFQAYERYVLSRQEGMFYYSLKYKEFLENLLGCRSHYLICLNGREVVGILPLMMCDGRYGIVCNSLPFYGSYGGILADDECVCNALFGAYEKLVNGGGFAAATIVMNPLSKNLSWNMKDDATDKRIGQFTQLPAGPDIEANVMEMIDPVTRRNVRKANKSGVDVTVDNDAMRTLRDMHVQNMHDIGGRSKSDVFFDAISKYFIPEEDYRVYVASIGGKPVSALLLFYYNKTVEYFVPAVSADARTFQPLSLIILRAMVDAAEAGFKMWNWGGTWHAQEGVYKFKKKWAAVDHEYEYHVNIRNDQLCTVGIDELVKEYGNFYVVPYEMLGGKKWVKGKRQ